MKITWIPVLHATTKRTRVTAQAEHWRRVCERIPKQLKVAQRACRQDTENTNNGSKKTSNLILKYLCTQFSWHTCAQPFELYQTNTTCASCENTMMLCRYSWASKQASTLLRTARITSRSGPKKTKSNVVSKTWSIVCDGSVLVFNPYLLVFVFVITRNQNTSRWPTMPIRTANQITSPQHKLEHQSSAIETSATQRCYYSKE